MIVGIDGNEANIKNKVGVNQMALRILWELFKLEDKKTYGNRYIIFLKNAPGLSLPPEKTFWKYKIIPGGRVWILTKLIPELFRGEKIDVFFSPSHYLPPLAPSPKVCCITDLGYLKFSGQFKKYDYWQLKYWTAISIIVSKYIIAISESTRRDIVRHYNFASGKTEVVYLGHDTQNYNLKIPKNFVRLTLNKYRISKNYIVFMSTLKPSKNIERLIEAFARLKKTYNYQLVIVGKKGWLFDTIFQKIKQLHVERDVVFTDYLEDNERGAILSGAKVFVLPSFWEGFGIDVLNAYACGVPVVVSKVASLPEVAGNAGFYVDPESVSSITKGIEKVLKMSPKEYNKQVEKGLNHLKTFSWQKTAEQTLKVLEKAAKS